jgi:hypothetical protein
VAWAVNISELSANYRWIYSIGNISSKHRRIYSIGDFGIGGNCFATLSKIPTAWFRLLGCRYLFKIFLKNIY